MDEDGGGARAQGTGWQVVPWFFGYTRSSWLQGALVHVRWWLSMDIDSLPRMLGA